jgi:hypothetical protein
MDGRYEIANGGRLFFDDGLHELAGALHTRIVRGRPVCDGRVRPQARGDQIVGGWGGGRSACGHLEGGGAPAYSRRKRGVGVEMDNGAFRSPDIGTRVVRITALYVSSPTFEPTAVIGGRGPCWSQ